MLNRLWLALAVSTLVSAYQAAEASPITYDFTGTLNQPLDGARTFSGSLTINADPTVSPGMQWVTESGSDVSLTMELGGQVINFVNTPQNPSFVWFQASEVPSGDGVPSGAPTIAFSVAGGYNGGNISFGMTFYCPGGAEQLADLRDLSFPLDTSSVGFEVFSGGTPQGVGGVITSFESASVPEPGSLVIFATLGTGVMVYRRRALSAGSSAQRTSDLGT